MSREVILGENGLVKGAKKGYVIADCSTVSPSESSRIAQELEALGMDFLDAPCTGSKAGAEGGTLTFMMAASRRSFPMSSRSSKRWVKFSIIVANRAWVFAPS